MIFTAALPKWFSQQHFQNKFTNGTFTITFTEAFQHFQNEFHSVINKMVVTAASPKWVSQCHCQNSFHSSIFSKIIITTAFLRWLLQWHFQNDIHSSISKISFNVIGFVYFRTLADSSCMTCFDDMFIFKGGSIFDVLCFLVRILSSFSLSIEMMLPSMFSTF